MRIRRSITAALAASVALGAPAFGEQLELTGTLRDFQQAHPDMQRQASGYPVVTGMVKDDLGQDGKPVLNIESNNAVTVGAANATNFEVTVTFGDGGVSADASTTWTRRSASASSSRVARNASTRSGGRSRMKPTVSVSTTSRSRGKRKRRLMGSRVANSLFSATASPRVRALSKVDLPALV